MSADLIVRGGHLVLPEAGVVEADLAISEGVIVDIGDCPDPDGQAEVIDARGLHVMPGAVDTHVHYGFRGDWAEHCRSDSWAAAFGGTTSTLILQAMAPGQFHELRRLGEENSYCDFIFSPDITSEETMAFIEESVEEWGCPSFKFFLAYRDVPGAPPGDDFNHLDDGLFLDALHRLAGWEGTLAVVHAENCDVNNRGIARVKAEGRDGLAAWEEANPAISEAEGIERAGRFAAHAGVPLYFVHLSGAVALEAVGRVRERWPHVRTETCPHHLYYDLETAPGTVKFSPPLRRENDREALWEAVADGRIDSIGSDNSSSLKSAKQGDVWSMARGGPNTAMVLPMILSEGVAKGRISLERAAEVTATTAARTFGLHPRKGSLAIGADADLAIVDLRLQRTLHAGSFNTWSDYNLYEGETFTGWPVMTVLRGTVVARDGEPAIAPGHGTFLRRSARRRSTV
ncbi:amidohydrolase family protein [soil metagenome]